MDFDEITLKLNNLVNLFKKASGLSKTPSRRMEYDRQSSLINDTIAILGAYIEPWICPDCGHVIKIPVCLKDPGRCPKCCNNRMLTYSYHEIKRMDGQLRLTLQCVEYYSKQHNGQIATETLRNLSKAYSVDLKKRSSQL